MEESTFENQEKLTPEQIKERMDKMEKFYDDKLPFLKKQLEYEESTARIEMARYNRTEAMFKLAQLSERIHQQQTAQTGKGSGQNPDL